MRNEKTEANLNEEKEYKIKAEAEVKIVFSYFKVVSYVCFPRYDKIVFRMIAFIFLKFYFVVRRNRTNV